MGGHPVLYVERGGHTLLTFTRDSATDPGGLGRTWQRPLTCSTMP